MNFPSLDDFKITSNNIKGYINETEIIYSSTINEKFNSNIYFKLELFQKTGSFKARGAINKVLKL